MAHTGFQTQLIYGSLTPGATPSAASLTTNLSGVELALNAADGKLFFKDTSGAVRVLAAASSIDNQAVAALTQGTIDGVTIGNDVPAAGSFTSLLASSLTIPGLLGIVKSSSNGFVAAVAGTDYVPGSYLGTAGGVATLDGTGKVPSEQLPNTAGGLVYKGTWDADTNTPTLVTGVGTTGHFYTVSVAGTTNLSGITDWIVGDQVVFGAVTWEQVREAQPPVQSVNGQTGNVVITPALIGAAGAGSNTDITSLSGLTTAIVVAQGGTGATTLTGLVKGNGVAPMTAAVAGTDYAAPTTATTSQLLAGNGAGGFANVTIGSGLSLTAGVLSSSGGGGSGSVTSVQASGGTTGMSFTGGPITTSGTLTLSGTLAVANGGTGVTTSTGTGSNVLSASPTFTGTVSGITKAMVGLANVDNTADSAKPVSTAQQTALNLKANLASPTFTGTVSGITKAMVGLANVDNTADASKSVLYAATAGSANDVYAWAKAATKPTYTKAEVGLSNVDNTADSAKPVSTAQQTALNLKANLASPAFTGSITLSSTTTALILNASAGTAGQVLTSAGAGATPTWQTPSVGAGTVTSVQASGGTTGLSFTGGPITNSGTLTLTGTLAVANGGTGKTTLTGLVKGNGTAAMTAAVAGTDYAAPTTATGSQILFGNGAGGFTNVDVGGGLLLSGGVLSAPGGGAGSVTSVQASGGTTGLTFSGGPITTSGTLTLAGTLAVANGGTGATTATGTGSVVRSVSPTFTGTVSGITKAMVGLANVDNTADANKSVLYAATAGSASASDVSAWAKAASKPTYTKAEVGLSNVDNTADSAKPVSTAQQTALNLKANLASPTFTGNVTLGSTTTALLLNASAGTAGQVLTSAGAGATPTWQTPSSGGTTTPVDHTGSATLGANTINNLLSGTGVVFTLPASPVKGSWVIIVDQVGNNNLTIARNGETINGIAQDMTFDTPPSTGITLYYVTNTWQIIQ